MFELSQIEAQQLQRRTWLHPPTYQLTAAAAAATYPCCLQHIGSATCFRTQVSCLYGVGWLAVCGWLICVVGQLTPLMKNRKMLLCWTVAAEQNNSACGKHATQPLLSSHIWTPPTPKRFLPFWGAAGCWLLPLLVLFLPPPATIFICCLQSLMLLIMLYCRENRCCYCETAASFLVLGLNAWTPMGARTRSRILWLSVALSCLACLKSLISDGNKRKSPIVYAATIATAATTTTIAFIANHWQYQRAQNSSLKCGACASTCKQHGEFYESACACAAAQLFA